MASGPGGRRAPIGSQVTGASANFQTEVSGALGARYARPPRAQKPPRAPGPPTCDSGQCRTKGGGAASREMRRAMPVAMPAKVKKVAHATLMRPGEGGFGGVGAGWLRG